MAAEKENYGIKKGLVTSLVMLVGGIIVIGAIAALLVFRVTVPPGKIGIINAKTGQDLPPGQILAKKGEKGIQEEFLSPGRYYFNPWYYAIEFQPEINIPGGKLGIVESFVGAPLPAGEILADKGQQGIQKQLLGPGTYRINPYAAKIHVADNVNIPAGHVGVQVAKTGKIPEKESILAKPGERGVLETLLPPGTHYINPYEFDMIVVSTQTQKLDMDANPTTNIVTKDGKILETEAIDFPSKDGFQIVADVTVEWSIDRNKVAEVVASIGTEDFIIDKVIRPNARSISRTEGSKYSAKDFIVGIGREEFQKTFFDKMGMYSKDRGIIIHRALIRKITVPDQIAEPIKQAVIATEEDLRNKQRTETARSAALLAQQEALAEQNRRQVEGETKKIEKQLEAEAVAVQSQIQAKQRLEVAKIGLESAEIEAQAILKTGTAEANVIKLKKTAEAEGLAASVKAFVDPKAFAMYEFANKISPNIRVVFAPAGQGTLWNSLDDMFKIGATGAAVEQMQKQTLENPK